MRLTVKGSYVHSSGFSSFNYSKELEEVCQYDERLKEIAIELAQATTLTVMEAVRVIQNAIKVISDIEREPETSLTSALEALASKNCVEVRYKPKDQFKEFLSRTRTGRRNKRKW